MRATRASSSAEAGMIELLREGDAINFGELPEEIDALLQRGVAAYRHDKSRADLLFRQALAAAPKELPIYFCLYKIHTYQGNLEEAQTAAERRPERSRPPGGMAARLAAVAVSCRIARRRRPLRALHPEGARLHPSAAERSARGRRNARRAAAIGSGGRRRMARRRCARRGHRLNAPNDGIGLAHTPVGPNLLEEAAGNDRPW